jgi:hypothetical protein
MEMKRSSLPQILFEMAVLRLTDVRPMQEIDALIDKINSMEGPSTTGGGTPKTVRGEAPSAQKAPPAPAQPAPKRDKPVDPPNVPGDRRQASTVNENCSGASPVPPSSKGAWQKIRSAAGAIKRPLGTYLDNCHLTALDGKEMRLSFPDPYTLGLVEKEENFEALQEAVAQVCGKPDIKIKLQLEKTPSAPAESVPQPPEPERTGGKAQGKKASASEEEILKDALDIFGGIVIR